LIVFRASCMKTDKEAETKEKETTELQIKLISKEEKKRFRTICINEEKTSAKMLIALMDRFEGREDVKG